MPANADNLFAAGRRLASMGKEPTVFMTRSELETRLRREKKKASIALVCLDLKRLYVVEVAASLSGGVCYSKILEF